MVSRFKLCSRSPEDAIRMYQYETSQINKTSGIYAVYLDYIFLFKEGCYDLYVIKITHTLPSASCQLKIPLYNQAYRSKVMNKTHTGTEVALEGMSFFDIALQVSQSQSEDPTRNGWPPVQIG